jgi:O-antigen ligase
LNQADDKSVNGRSVVRPRLAQLADQLAFATVVALPWSTSVTIVLIALWVIVVLPAFSPAEIGREIATPAGGLPVALVALAICGMFWANVDWSERLGGADGFFKLLAIPILLVQFRRSDRSLWTLIGYLASCTALLAVSWILVVWPQTRFLATTDIAVPVKSATSQSSAFTICLFALLFSQSEHSAPGAASRWPACSHWRSSFC